MTKQTTRLLLAGAIAASASMAHAGGFALKEASTSAQGTSFASATSGDDDITYSFFNPAALRSVKGLQFAFSNSFIAPSAELETSGGTFDGGESAFLGAFYIGARVSEKTVVGISVSAPFGLATEYDKQWTGKFDGLRTDLRTFAISPMISYDITKDFTIGVGFTYLYGTLVFENARNLGFTANSELTGDGDAFGFSAGFLWDVTPHATIGVAFKSGYNFNGEGKLEIRSGLFNSDTDGVKASADLPGVLSFGASFDVTDRFRMMGEVQWQMWSSLDVFSIHVPGQAPTPDTFGYKDALFVAVGGEYKATDDFTLRTGVAFDQTPTVDSHRSPRIPDGDRMWLSAGASYKMTDKLKIDLAYSYLFTLEKSAIPLDTDGNGVDDETASSKGRVHILSLGASYDF
ncbi:MAG: OmpP1/FadL family transporter [Neomegalonema sp.]|nr:OmpP1/FadL family transporter [Neomegalonema sp.]